MPVATTPVTVGPTAEVREADPHRTAPWRYATATVAAVLGGLLLAGGALYGRGADLAHHYWLASWWYDRLVLHAAPAYTPSGHMEIYPPGAHVAAAAAGVLTGSPLVGMHVVSVLATVLLWVAVMAVLAQLALPARAVALAAVVCGLVLSSPYGPVAVQFHGWELVDNYFYAQLVGQALFWCLVWWTAHALARGAGALRLMLPTAVTAVLSTSVHLMATLQLLVLLGLVGAASVLARWRQGARGRALLLPVGVVAAAAALVAGSPGLRAMREISLNDGDIALPYLSSVGRVLLLCLVVLGVAAVTALLAVRAAAGDEGGRAAGLALAAAAVAVVVPCLVQAAALQLGEGSPYGVKKYGFGLATVLLLLLAVSGGLLVPSRRRSGVAAQAARPAPLLVAGLALLAVASVFARPADIALSDARALEERARGVSSTLLDRGRDGVPAAAVGLPGGSSSLDYAFSLAPFGNPGADPVGLAVLGGTPLPPAETAGRRLVVPETTVPDGACPVRGPFEGLVVVDGTCWLGQAGRCRTVHDLGTGAGAAGVLEEGFGAPEPGGRWTVGDTAAFRCALPDDTGTDVLVTVVADAFLPPSVSGQRLVLRAGDRAEAFELRRGEATGRFSLLVPAEAGQVDLRLELPDATSPAEAGAGPDGRQLGFFVRSVSVVPQGAG